MNSASIDMKTYRVGYRKAIGIGFIVDFLTLGISVWALLNNVFQPFQSVSLVAWVVLLVTPFVVGVACVRASEGTQSTIHAYWKALYRVRWIIAVCVSLVPLVAVHWIYFSEYVSAIFSRIVMCADRPCLSGPSVELSSVPEVLSQAPVISTLLIGLLGGNLLSSALGATLAKGRKSLAASALMTSVCLFLVDVTLIMLLLRIAPSVSDMIGAIKTGIGGFVLLALPTNLLAWGIVLRSRRRWDKQDAQSNLSSASITS
jgi:hypothetical protein